jgi:hypothetical protein
LISVLDEAPFIQRLIEELPLACNDSYLSITTSQSADAPSTSLNKSIFWNDVSSIELIVNSCPSKTTINFKTTDSDGWTNAKDTYFNYNGVHITSTFDFDTSFVLFRTTAPFSEELRLSDFGTGTFIATLNTTSKDLVNFSSDYTSLTRYSYIGRETTLPESAAPIVVTLNQAEPRDVQTPDGRGVYFGVISGIMTVYICGTVGAQQSGYYKYRATALQGVNTSLRVNWVNGHQNEISGRQVTIDWRMATSTDNDFDGIPNNNETCPAASWDRDWDDDGLMDGTDPYYNNSDGDSDGLPDGLESGVTAPIPPMGSMINGTNWNPETPQNNPIFPWNSPAGQINVPRFITDQNPSTVTSPTSFDTDGDGVRDGIELGLTVQQIEYYGATAETFASWTERIARYGTPFIYDFIPNWDADPQTTTDPNKIDSDADGLPDGWMDGWVYRSSPLDPSQERTYQNTMDLANIEMKYDAARWMDGGNPDNMLQVYEGEDLDCNGAVAESGAWNFMNDTKERTPNFKETDSTMEDSEPAASQIPDGIPDGYEVWYSSMMEPVRKLNGDLFFSPLTNDTYKDDDLIEDTLYEPQNGETLGPTFFGPEGSVIALAQRVYFGANSVFGGSADISKITRIQVQLNMSRATNLKLTMEIWDYRLDYISYDPESLSTALENVTIMADEKVTTGASADPAGVGGCATRRNGPSFKKTNDGAHQSAGWHGKSVWTG